MTKVLYNGYAIDLPANLENNEKETDLFTEKDNLEDTKEFNINEVTDESSNIDNIDKTIEFTEEGAE